MFHQVKTMRKDKMNKRGAKISEDWEEKDDNIIDPFSVLFPVGSPVSAARTYPSLSLKG
jgi:hypothetical protein